MDKGKNISNPILMDFVTNGGFDAMSVSSIRELMFKYLMEEDGYKDKSDFELSLFLKVKKSTVSALRKKYLIRYGQEDLEEKAKEVFFSSFKLDAGDNIRMQVNDDLVRDYIFNLLESGECLYDISFNKKVISMPPVSFCVLAGKLSDVKDADDLDIILDRSKDNINNFFKKAEPSVFQNIVSELKHNSISVVLKTFGIALSCVH